MGKVYFDDYLIRDFTLAEIKMLRRKQRHGNRNQFLNNEFQIYTVEEAIESLILLNSQFPRNDLDFPVGLYIEPKEYTLYKIFYGVDMLDMLHESLAKYDLETIEKCTNKVPIIIQSFEIDALWKYATLSDLPLVYLLAGDGNRRYDFEYISKHAHGVGPNLKVITSYLDEEYNKDTPSDFVLEAHSHDLGVHPYEIRDDFLGYEDNIMEEHKLFVTKGVDGLFTEFPHTTFAAFTYFPSSNTFPSQ